MTIKKKKMQELINEIVGESYSIGDITTEHLKFGMELCDKDVESLKVVQENSVELQKMIENLNADENILPRPVIRDGNGKLIKDHSPRDFFLKLQEEIFESFKANFEWFLYRDGRLPLKMTSANSAKENFAEEIADVITVCISYLNANGYDEEKRSELFEKVNEKNEKRGYFKEVD